MQGRVERFGGLKIASERLLDDDACAGVAARRLESVGDGGEEVRRNRQIEQRTCGSAERRSQARERLRVLIVALYESQLRRQHVERLRIEAAVLFQARARAGAQPLDVRR